VYEGFSFGVGRRCAGAAGRQARGHWANNSAHASRHAIALV